MAINEEVLIINKDKLLVAAISVFIGWSFYQLSLVLIPLFISALLAYITDPLADRLERWKLSRIIAVSMVFLVLIIFTLLILLILIPLLSSQLDSLLSKLPEYAMLLNYTLQSWLISIHLPADLFNINTITQSLTNYWK